MIVLGITGGVGAGKSTVLEYLEEKYGAEVIQADKVGHLLMKKGEPCYTPVLELLGEKILDREGNIDRKRVAALVFSDSLLLQSLNRIIHPEVKKYILGRRDEADKKGSRLFVVEAALLLEEHYDEICHDLWYIYVEDGLRRRRLKTQRGYSDEKISDICSNQMADGEFRSRCSYVIGNNGDLRHLYQEIDKRIRTYEIM